MKKGKLSRKQQAAIAALLTEATLAEAAEKVGVVERTIRNRQKLPEFQAAFRAAAKEVLDRAIGRLQKASGEAVDTLRKNLSSGAASVEVRAAQIIIDQSAKFLELGDLEERLATLEQFIQEQMET